MRISDWSSDVCSSDLLDRLDLALEVDRAAGRGHFRDMRGGQMIVIVGGHRGRAARESRTRRQHRSGVQQDRDILRAERFAAKIGSAVVLGKSVSVRVDLGGCRIIKQKK